MVNQVVLLNMLLTLLAACGDTAPDTRHSPPSSVGKLVVQAYLFEEEKLTVKVDDSVYYVRTRHAGNMEKFVESVALPAKKIASLTVVTQHHGHTYIDTTFSITDYDAEGMLRIVISVPFPFDYTKYTDTVPYRKWGVLPIDSCIRFVRWQKR